MAVTTSRNPSTFDTFENLAPWTTSHWFALYTRSRHEKFVSDYLQKKGIETFLPLRRIQRNWSDRKKIISEPLFKGYVFIHTSLSDRWTILNTKGAVCFVGPSAARPVIVPENQLAAIRRFTDEDVAVNPFPYLKEGHRVYVRTGPFKGAEGFIVRKDEKCRLIVSIDSLMKSVSIEIDQACVEPL